MEGGKEINNAERRRGREGIGNGVKTERKGGQEKEK
jgi:hypothetical protein